MTKEMLNINLFGGPGTGKSTTAAGLFYLMKTNDYRIEYIQEYAKELTFGKDYTKLSDQLLILGEQHHRMYRLKDQLDYLVHDSPFVMGLVYLQDDVHLPKEQYTELITKMFKSYNNLNIFLERNVDDHSYQEYGRGQSLSEAEQKDKEIKDLLDEYKIPYVTVKMGDNAVQSIYNNIREQNA